MYYLLRRSANFHYALADKDYKIFANVTGGPWFKKISDISEIDSNSSRRNSFNPTTMETTGGDTIEWYLPIKTLDIKNIKIEYPELFI